VKGETEKPPAPKDQIGRARKKQNRTSSVEDQNGQGGGGIDHKNGNQFGKYRRKHQGTLPWFGGPTLTGVETKKGQAGVKKRKSPGDGSGGD